MMKRSKRTITSPFLIFFLLLFGESIFCQQYQQNTLYNASRVPIHPFSKKGKALFEQGECVAQYVSTDYGLDQYYRDDCTIHNGQLVVGGTIGDYRARVGADIIGLLQFIPAFLKAICRTIDINGHYYREDTQDTLEQILYEVDKARHEIYDAHRYGFGIPYRSDAQYLRTKIYELEIQIAASGRKTALRAASTQACDKLRRSLEYIESQCAYTPEELSELRCAALSRAADKVWATPFKNKRDKQQLLTKYQEALAHEERQYYIYRAAVVEQQARAQELQRQQCVRDNFSTQLPLLENGIRKQNY